MNIAMMDLQDHLFDQSLPLTPEQQENIQSHPILGSALLRQCGVEDETWHALVLYHHELRNGSGYPIGLGQNEIDPLAHWITLADICCAKLTGRSYRSSILPAKALAQMFRVDNGAYDPTQTAMLIKELSIYPPGSFVRLASYEIGVVVSRGKKGHEPRVAT
jgi:HD-GYP domain-containing protein (c-di-GMP phosphodiesterase class II)